MNNSKKRCTYCHSWYAPDVRIGEDQSACWRAECRKKRKAQSNRSWRIRHPKYAEGWKLKIRDWAERYPNYWRQWRARHPEYVLRDNRRRVLSAKRARRSAKVDAIRQISVEKIRSIQEMGGECSAKVDAIRRRVNGIVDYLSWKEHSAKKDVTDLALSP